jgi:hypothetical protein
MQDRQATRKPGNWLVDLYVHWPTNRVVNRVLVVLLLTIPMTLWLLPANFFDDEGGPALCPSRFLLGLECPGCGLTRAVMHLHHFDLAGALYYHWGVVVAYPLLVLLWILALRKTVRRLTGVS